MGVRGKEQRGIERSGTHSLPSPPSPPSPFPLLPPPLPSPPASRLDIRTPLPASSAVSSSSCTSVSSAKRHHPPARRATRVGAALAAARAQRRDHVPGCPRSDSDSPCHSAWRRLIFQKSSRCAASVYLFGAPCFSEIVTRSGMNHRFIDYLMIAHRFSESSSNTRRNMDRFFIRVLIVVSVK